MLMVIYNLLQFISVIPSFLRSNNLRCLCISFEIRLVTEKNLLVRQNEIEINGNEAENEENVAQR